MIYNVRLGWGPLCKFLGLDVPSLPFPFNEECGKLQEEHLFETSVFVQIHQEVKTIIVVICLAIGYFAFNYVTDSEPETHQAFEFVEANSDGVFELFFKPLTDYVLKLASLSFLF